MSFCEKSLKFSPIGHRVFHGRGGGFPSWEKVNIEFYPPLLLIELYAELPEEQFSYLINALKRRFENKMETILLQKRWERSGWEVIEGEIPEKPIASDEGLKYHLQIGSNRNIGFFPDMRLGREWLRQNTKGSRVLNLFSYSCVLSLVALDAGAEHVINVDMAKGALELGRKNHEFNNIPKDKVTYRKIDIMKSLGSLVRQGPYDLIIIDPPSFQKGSFDVNKDYEKIIKRLDQMLKPGGRVLSCLNSPFHTSEFLKSLFKSFAPDLILQEILYRPDFYQEVDPEKGLKLCIYQKEGA